MHEKLEYKGLITRDQVRCSGCPNTLENPTYSSSTMSVSTNDNASINVAIKTFLMHQTHPVNISYEDLAGRYNKYKKNKEYTKGLQVISTPKALIVHLTR